MLRDLVQVVEGEIRWGILSDTSYIDMNGPKGYASSAILVWKAFFHPRQKKKAWLTVIREFKKTTTAMATETSLNKKFNEKNTGSARAL